MSRETSLRIPSLEGSTDSKRALAAYDLQDSRSGMGMKDSKVRPNLEKTEFNRGGDFGVGLRRMNRSLPTRQGEDRAIPSRRQKRCEVMKSEEL